MGNFSYLCSECEHPINVGWANDGHSEHCILFLKIDGEVVEWMRGNYDGYGRVRKPLEDFHSQEWETRPFSPLDTDHAMYGTLDPVLDLPDFGPNGGENGIAAYHSGCYLQGEPEVSESDGEQGFGEIEFPTNGGPTKSDFRHETARKTQPVWKKAK